MPALAIARRPAPSLARRVSVRRSHTRRGRSSAKASAGYRPASISSTARKASSGSSAKFAARRTSAPSSPTVQGSIEQAATTCWASTSRGLRGRRVSSISPSRIRRATTVASSRSARWVGMTTPRAGSPTRWRARPIRWSPRATDRGDSTCTTRSTAAMSMPSSREEVATIPRSSPRFSRSSISRRRSRAIEPWWAATSSVPASSFRRAARRSARRRWFTNTIVEVWERTSSSRRGSTPGQIEPREGMSPGVAGPSRRGIREGSAARAEGSAMSSTGTSTVSSIGRPDPASTIRTGRGVPSRYPPRYRATTSSGRWVADRPIRCGGVRQSASSRSSESARCAPRSFGASACTSSTMTQRTGRRISRVRLVSMRKRDSGVVMSTSGGRRAMSRRSRSGVSPVRMATVGSWSGSPSRSAASAIPVSGARRFFSTSTARARSGET
ncbi:MAG: hypothetical protein KatS3mg014_2174 [Actinomycetota bacterium]|nr:MAG: hypothetical protein KatS3mg014_2174 [Actinomycetota bacterium]